MDRKLEACSETDVVATACMGQDPVRLLVCGDDGSVLIRVRDSMIRHLSSMLRMVIKNRLVLESGTELEFVLGIPTESEERSYDRVFYFKA